MTHYHIHHHRSNNRLSLAAAPLPLPPPLPAVRPRLRRHVAALGPGLPDGPDPAPAWPASRSLSERFRLLQVVGRVDVEEQPLGVAEPRAARPRPANAPRASVTTSCSRRACSSARAAARRARAVARQQRVEPCRPRGGTTSGSVPLGEVGEQLGESRTACRSRRRRPPSRSARSSAVTIPSSGWTGSSGSCQTGTASCGSGVPRFATTDRLDARCVEGRERILDQRAPPSSSVAFGAPIRRAAPARHHRSDRRR